MPNFPNPPTPAFVDIPMIIESDPVQGGLVGTEPSNKQAKLLVERTQFLKNSNDTLFSNMLSQADDIVTLEGLSNIANRRFLDYQGVFSNVLGTINVTSQLIGLAVIGTKIYVLKPTKVEVYLESTGVHLSGEDFGVGVLLDPKCIRSHNGLIYVLDDDPSVFKIQCFNPSTGAYVPINSISLTGPSTAVCFIMDEDHAYVLYAGQTPTNYLYKHEIVTGDEVRSDGFASGTFFDFASMFMKGTVIYFTGVGSNNLLWEVDINFPTSFSNQSSGAFTCGVFVRGDRYYISHSDVSQKDITVRRYTQVIWEQSVKNLIVCVFMLFIPTTRKVYYASLNEIKILTLEERTLD